MENTKELTVEQVLRITVEQLNSVAVPINHLDSIGVPIKRAIDNLRSCLNAFEAAAKQAEKENEPQIEIVPHNEVPPDAEVVDI